MNAMFNDDGKDPPPRKSNEHSKKKQKVDSSTPVVKKPLRKKQVDSFDEHTQMRTPAPRAVKADGMKKPIFKSIPTRQTSSSKMMKVKQTAREDIEDIEADKQEMLMTEDKDPELQNMDYVGTEKSPQRLSLEVDQELEANLLGKKINRGITDSEVELDTEEQVRTPPNTRKRCIFLYDSYESSGHYAAVLAEIEKIEKIISLCLQACDFYVKKGIDHQSHPKYKDKESSDMFDVLFQDDLPQQPSESLDCGVFMVMYAECLSYDHKVIASEFDPNTLHTRYAALLWDYGIRKQEANAISNVEAPVRPARQSRTTSVTEVVDV
ncbi:hypothetical protein FXO38_29674 [Capsicum annuum]|nr:hypothetical protein FXO38_29674 [Capsicum annuum]